MQNFRKLTLYILILSPWFLVGSISNAKSYDYSSKIDYGTIQKELFSVTKKSTEKFYKDISASYIRFCRNKKTKNFTYGKLKLNCDIDIEKVLKGRSQKVLSSSISLPSSNISGAEISSTSKINVNLSLRGLKRQFPVSLLDYKRSESILESQFIYNNIYLKHNIVNSKLLTSICMDLPGMQLSTSNTPVELKLSKKIWWRFYAEANIKIDWSLGSYKYETAKFCSVVKTQVSQQEIENIIEGKDSIVNSQSLQVYLSDPKLSKLTFEGLQIEKIKVKGSNVLTKIAFKVFQSYKKKIITQIKSNLNAVLKEQLRRNSSIANNALASGQIWKEYTDKVLIPAQIQLVNNLNQALFKALNSGTDSKINLTKVVINKYCNQLNSDPDLKAYNINSICKEIIEKVEFEPFVYNHILSKRNCYTHNYMLNGSANLARTTSSQSQIVSRTSSPKSFFFNFKQRLKSLPKVQPNNWWKKGCFISSSFTVFPSAKYERTYACLHSSATNRLSYNQAYKGCINTILSDAGI